MLPKSRLPVSVSSPFYRVDGTKVAKDGSDLCTERGSRIDAPVAEAVICLLIFSTALGSIDWGDDWTC